MIVTSSVDGGHGMLVIDHLNTYVTPAVPVNVLVGLAGAVIIPPIPLTILHAPDPTTGVFPANVTIVNPHVAAPV